MLAELHDVPAEFRQARYHCVIVFIRSPEDPEPLFAHGTWEARLPSRPAAPAASATTRSSSPANLHRTAAEMAPEEKNTVSHRAQALFALVAELKEMGLAS